MKLLFIVNLLKKNAFLTKRIYFLFDNHKFKAVFFLLVYRNLKYPSTIWKVNLEIPKEKVIEIFSCLFFWVFNGNLKVVSAKFLLVCFLSLKESTCETRKNVFNLTSKNLFRSRENQILDF